MVWFAGWALLGACGSPADDTGLATSTSTYEPVEQPCEPVVLASMVPEDGAQGLHPATRIEALVAEGLTSSLRLGVVDVGTGEQVAGRSEILGDRVIFTPSERLPPLAQLEAGLGTCEGSIRWQFSTNDVGSALVPLDVMLGSTVLLDLPEAAAVGGLGAPLPEPLASVFGTPRLVQVVDAGLFPDQVHVVVAAVDPSTGDQDLCVPTQGPFQLEAILNPEFSTWDSGPGLWTDPGARWSLPVERVDLAMEVNPDMSLVQFGGVSLTQLDVRGLDAELGGACAAFEGAGEACGPCPDGVEACVDISLDWIDGVGVDVDVVVRPLEDIVADPACP